MKLKEIGILILLAALWGASFLFMKVAVPELGPIFLIDVRVIIAALVLVIYAIVIKHRPHLLHKWKEYLLLGALNAAIPFCLIAASELRLESSLAAILNATTPLFTAIVAFLWTKDPFTPKKGVGLVLGILGVGILVGWNPQHFNPQSIFSVFLSLGAALLYGIGGVYTSKKFRNEKPLDLAIGSQVSAGILLLPVAAFFVPDQIPGSDVILSVIALAVFSTSLGYLLFFFLIKNVGPIKALSVTFLVPVFGVLWGWMFLGESLSSGIVFGLLIILLSITLVTNIRLNLRSKKLEDTKC